MSKNPSFGPKRPPFPVHPGEQSKALSVGPLPQVGSAFPAPAPKAATPAVTDGKYSAFVGSYDSGTMGTLVVRQEGDKLFALDPGGQRIELVPDATADKFMAQPVNASVSFERDAANKVVAIIVTLSDGRVIRGRKT